MLALPGVAVLAAVALPTLQRGSTAAIDWFSVFFFSGCAVTIWVFYTAMQTGTPARALATVLRLAPGFQGVMPVGALVLALLASAAWLGLVRWRTGRHRAVIWKSLVLPAGGVALCWLLLMTLWLPLLDYGRSNRPLVERLLPLLPPPTASRCIAAPQANQSLVAAWEFHGRWRVDARPDADQGNCQWLLQARALRGPGVDASIALATSREAAGWQALGRARRPTDRNEELVLYRRAAAGAISPALSTR